MSKTKSGCSRADAIHAAIQRLAALYEYGVLQADTDPAAFLNRVADDVAALRADPAPARSEGTAADALERCKCGSARDEHGGPYGEGACEASGCDAFEPAAGTEGEARAWVAGELRHGPHGSEMVHPPSLAPAAPPTTPGIIPVPGLADTMRTAEERRRERERVNPSPRAAPPTEGSR